MTPEHTVSRTVQMSVNISHDVFQNMLANVVALELERDTLRTQTQAQLELNAALLMDCGVLTNKNQALLAERDIAISMLAEWCVAVDTGGSAWDYWDEHYKYAMYRPNPIRELLDAAIKLAEETDV